MPRILIVEDEPSIAENLVYALKTENFDPVHVMTGEEGLEVFSEGFDLVVLDVGLPDQTGFDVCRKLRQSSEVPVVFLTARDSEVDRVLGLEMGGDDYVTKPFSPRELVARIRAILRRCGRLGSSDTAADPEDDFIARVGRLCHDEKRKTISCDDQNLDLTVHEYRLLLTLLAHPGRVYSRGQLMQAAWEDPGAAMERTVDAHIKSLRAKLRSASEGADAIIETRRGLGYALREE